MAQQTAVEGFLDRVERAAENWRSDLPGRPVTATYDFRREVAGALADLLGEYNVPVDRDDEMAGLYDEARKVAR